MSRADGARPPASMRTLPPQPDGERLEAEAREFWSAHALPERPPADRGYPPATVAIVVEAVPAARDVPLPELARLVVADVAARYLRLAGRPVRQTLFLGPAPEGPPLASPEAELEHFGLWLGRDDLRPTRSPEAAAAVHRLIAAMATQGMLMGGDRPVPACVRCRELRAPDRIHRRDEPRPTYLIRFGLAGFDPPLSALVWTDALWKLLGAEAVLLHPDRAYARVRFERQGSSEEVLVARSSLEMLSDLLPNARWEVLEERPGSQWTGVRYEHPLRAEMPALGRLEAPSGTLLPSTEVAERGSGLVVITPGHGPSDAAAAPALGLPLRAILDEGGLLSSKPVHKYSGLPLETAEACLERDLTDDGRIFADFRERRGVPRCAICGTEVIWVPSREWYLDPGRLGTTGRERFERLAAASAVALPAASGAWPATVGRRSASPLDPELAECSACGRLYPPPGPGRCECDRATPEPLRRTLQPSLEEALFRWSVLAPLPSGGSIWLVLPRRRLGPQLLQELLALEAAQARPAEVRVVVAETLAPEGSAEALAHPPPVDAVRAALLRLSAGNPVRQTLSQAIVEETHRLYRLWGGTRRVLEAMSADGFSGDSRGIAAHLGELLPEDRAFLSALERMRLEVLRAYDRGAWVEGYLRLSRFLDRSFRERYLPVTAARWRAPSGSPSRTALFHTAHHALGRLAELEAPVLPHFAEEIHRALDGDAASLFQGRFGPIVDSALEPGAEAALERWGEIAAAVRSGRRRRRIPSATTPLQAVVVAHETAEAERLRAEPEVLARLFGTKAVEVCGPDRPWTGRRIEVRQNPDALREAFPSSHRRVATVLGQLDPRRIREGLRTQTLSVALGGEPPV
ncbi:MAG: class I tRNA ligase family protein, partial [Thermoplasmata archaeon]